MSIIRIPTVLALFALPACAGTYAEVEGSNDGTRGGVGIGF